MPDLSSRGLLDDDVITAQAAKHGELVGQFLRIANELKLREPKTREEARIHNTVYLLTGLTTVFADSPAVVLFDECCEELFTLLQRTSLEVLVAGAQGGDDFAAEMVEKLAHDPESAAKAQAFGITLDSGRDKGVSESDAGVAVGILTVRETWLHDRLVEVVRSVEEQRPFSHMERP